jgi:hypothetical protein
MRKTIKFIYVLGLIAFIHLSLCNSNGSAVDPYPLNEIPIFPKGYNIKKNFNPSKGTKSIIYHVQIDYPAAEVLEFYDSYFNGNGWRSSFEICQRNWEDFINDSKAGTAAVRGLYASWTHSGFNLKAVLWLRYEMFNKHDQGEVIVKCQLQPAVDNLN